MRGDGSADRSFVFRHPLIHEVAYGSLVTSTRRAMHGRVGGWLEEHGGEERVAELARHFEHSDDREKARHYLRLAGERAHALNASREAFDWFRAAADAYADEPEERGRLLEAAAQEIYLLGETDARDEDPGGGDRHPRGGRERSCGGQRPDLAGPIHLAARRPGGGGATERPRRRGARAVRTEPGAGDGLQLPRPEPDARSRLRRRGALGAQGDRGRGGDRRDGGP